MLIIGIESSCDDTAVSIIDSSYNILSNNIITNLELHQKYGGVVPEIASRNHLMVIEELIQRSLKDANVTINDIDLFCATTGPGLIGGLVIGATICKSMAFALGKPFVAVNHLHGHSLAPFLDNRDLKFPYLNLLLSGGHSMLTICNENYNFKLLGQTLDDSFGEAFDKVAKMLGHPYPGGPEIEKLASLGDESSYKMPIPLRNSGKIEFSLSGLKTHIRILINDLISKDQLSEKSKQNIAASMQKTLWLHLEDKIKLACREFNKIHNSDKIYHFVFTGGVAANKYIQNKITELLKEANFTPIFLPKKLCSDNAAMIAIAGYLKYQTKGKDPFNFPPMARWPIDAA
ncbi:MAG: tRNA (adenosine(37)-N6)-threonylcarbamoyltransferase complex transferase subunit TsaD [Rickettsiales bacterium]|jgi:N6-L-threonylcarbamoyladenine synthase|nr:tRNA (adenosine(37)-N6)-threonylcarbamoyltransferase complex transferase subunit TsaD [Rickettsiales bacterium]